MPTLARDGGVRLHVETSGGGRPLLLVHGWSRSGADLAPLAERLAPWFRAVRPDLRGHGRSTPGPLTLDVLADDLAAVAAAEGLERAVLLGWSLGGLAALAALPALRPRLAGLVLVGATPRFTEGEGWPHGLPARAVEGLALRVRRQPARALARFFDDCLAPGEADEALRRRLAPLRDGMLPDLQAALDGLAVLARADLRAVLPRVDLPALVIHGEADPICLPGAGRALAAAVPGARLAVLAGAGHLPVLTRTGEVAGLVRAFAEELP
jgi:pimeloyl-[acyl-carrier protein] methyl ester esterase